MKRILTLLLLVATLFTTMPVVFAANYHTYNGKVFVNQSEITFDVKPFLDRNRTMTSIRPIFEKLGYEVNWVQAERKVIISKGDLNLTLTIDDMNIYKNGTAIPLDVPAQLIDGRTMIPISLPAQALGHTVIWEPGSTNIYIDCSADFINEKESGYMIAAFRKVQPVGICDKILVQAELLRATGINGTLHNGAGFGEAAYVYVGVKSFKESGTEQNMECGFSKTAIGNDWFFFANVFSYDQDILVRTEAAIDVAGGTHSRITSGLWISFPNLTVPDGAIIEMELSEQNNAIRFCAKDVSASPDKNLIEIDFPYEEATAGGMMVDYRMVCSYIGNTLRGKFDGGMQVNVNSMKLYNKGKIMDWTGDWGFTEDRSKGAGGTVTQDGQRTIIRFGE